MQNILSANNLIFDKESIRIRTIPLKICLLEIFSRIAGTRLPQITKNEDYSQTIDNYSETYEEFFDR